MATIQDAGTGTSAEVTSDKNLKVTTPLVPAQMGGMRIFSENDSVANYLKSPETSSDYRLRVGLDTLLFTDTFNTTTQPYQNYTYTTATTTASWAGAGSVNFTGGTTNAHGAFVRSYRYFPLFGTAPLAAEFTFGMFVAQPQANEVWLMGLGVPGGATTEPTDGVWFQYTTAGIIGVIRYNGSTTQTGVLYPFGSVALGEVHKFTIVVGEGEIEWWRDDVLLGETDIPVSNGQPFIQGSLPLFMMKYNTGAVTSTASFRVSDITISLMDLATNKPWNHQLAGMGLAWQAQNGATSGQNTTWTNNAVTAAAALTNTTALLSTLGGIALITPTLTANLDGIVCSYLNPASTVNITGRTLYITGVRIDSTVQVVLANTGSLLAAFALFFGNTALSHGGAGNVADAAAVKGSRKIPLGIQAFNGATAVGTSPAPIQIQFSTPIAVNPGEYVGIVLKNIGTVTTSGNIATTVMLDHYYE